jgi:hypothetical protein
MVEITTDELALTENARALSGKPVTSVSPLVNFEVHVGSDTNFLDIANP